MKFGNGVEENMQLPRPYRGFGRRRDVGGRRDSGERREVGWRREEDIQRSRQYRSFGRRGDIGERRDVGGRRDARNEPFGSAGGMSVSMKRRRSPARDDIPISGTAEQPRRVRRRTSANVNKTAPQAEKPPGKRAEEDLVGGLKVVGARRDIGARRGVGAHRDVSAPRDDGNGPLRSAGSVRVGMKRGRGPASEDNPISDRAEEARRVRRRTSATVNRTAPQAPKHQEKHAEEEPVRPLTLEQKTTAMKWLWEENNAWEAVKSSDNAYPARRFLCAAFGCSDDPQKPQHTSHVHAFGKSKVGWSGSDQEWMMDASEMLMKDIDQDIQEKQSSRKWLQERIAPGVESCKKPPLGNALLAMSEAEGEAKNTEASCGRKRQGVGKLLLDYFKQRIPKEVGKQFGDQKQEPDLFPRDRDILSHGGSWGWECYATALEDVSRQYHDSD